MGSSDKFCLRWNDFESNISTAFRELREDKDFFDVTIVCDEDQVQAHKVILSACSPFFRSVLRRNLHKHPLLYMKGVKYVDIVSVLNFMYHGEVNVAQEELNSFLAVAEDLKVKGLTQNDSTNASKLNKTPPPQTPRPKTKEPPGRPEFHPHPLPKRAKVSRIPPASDPSEPKYNPTSYEDEIEEIQEIVPIKSEPGSAQATQDSPYEDTTLHPSAGVVADPTMDNSIYGDELAEYSQYEELYDEGAVAQPNMEGTKELDALVDQMMSKTVNLGQTEYVCNVCQKIMKKKQHMMKHVETHIQGVTHACNLCGKTFKTRNSLETHKHAYHKGGENQNDYSWSHSSTF